MHSVYTRSLHRALPGVVFAGVLGLLWFYGGLGKLRVTLGSVGRTRGYGQPCARTYTIVYPWLQKFLRAVCAVDSSSNAMQTFTIPTGKIGYEDVYLQV